MNKGFVLIDYLLLIFILMISLTMMMNIFMIMDNYSFLNQKVQDEIMLYQLRKIMVTSNEFEINNSMLAFDFDNKRWELYHTNNKVILAPGVQVVFDDIDEVYFKHENNLIYICFKRNGQFVERVLTNYD